MSWRLEDHTYDLKKSFGKRNERTYISNSTIFNEAAVFFSTNIITKRGNGDNRLQEKSKKRISDESKALRSIFHVWLAKTERNEPLLDGGFRQRFMVISRAQFHNYHMVIGKSFPVEFFFFPPPMHLPTHPSMTSLIFEVSPAKTTPSKWKTTLISSRAVDLRGGSCVMCEGRNERKGGRESGSVHNKTTRFFDNLRSVGK